MTHFWLCLSLAINRVSFYSAERSLRLAKLNARRIRAPARLMIVGKEYPGVIWPLCVEDEGVGVGRYLGVGVAVGFRVGVGVVIKPAVGVGLRVTCGVGENWGLGVGEGYREVGVGVGKLVVGNGVTVADGEDSKAGMSVSEARTVK